MFPKQRREAREQVDHCKGEREEEGRASRVGGQSQEGGVGRGDQGGRRREEERGEWGGDTREEGGGGGVCSACLEDVFCCLVAVLGQDNVLLLLLDCVVHVPRESFRNLGSLRSAGQRGAALLSQSSLCPPRRLPPRRPEPSSRPLPSLDFPSVFLPQGKAAKAPHLVVLLGGSFRLAGDDERSPGFVDEDGIHLVDDTEVEVAED